MRLRLGVFNCASICRAARGASRDRNRRPRFVGRLRNGCAIGSAGKRVRCAQRTHSHGDNGSSK
jgi:hypothetical protein